MRLNQRTLDSIDSPITTTYDLVRFRADERELLNLAQAVPPYPPAPQVIEHVEKVAASGLEGSGYTEVPGLPKVREAFAAELSRDYAGQVDAANVLVTAGCNQAFCLLASTLADPGDEIIVPVPYYFNHDMWLKLDGIRPRYLEPGPDLVPRVEDARALIGPRTRAILLVTPGNPGGLTLDPGTIAEFAALAREHDIALILDETYRSFRDTDAPAHDLFADPAWGEVLVSLHSFSKDLAIPGYRVGAIVASPELHREVAKLMDCVAVCAPRIGQEAVWAGLTQAQEWRAERSAEVARNRQAFVEAMAERPGGFELLSSGGYFGWVRHPFAAPTSDVVRDLVAHQSLLLVPGTAFTPDDRAMLRFSVSNLPPESLGDLLERLREAGAGAPHRSTV